MSSGFPTRSDTKRAVQPQKIVEADLRLCVRTCKKQGVSGCDTYDRYSHIRKTLSSMTGCPVSVSVAGSKNLYLFWLFVQLSFFHHGNISVQK